MKQNIIVPEPPGTRHVSAHKKKPTESTKEKTGATAEEIRKAVEVVGFDRAKVEEYIKQHLHQS